MKEVEWNRVVGLTCLFRSGQICTAAWIVHWIVDRVDTSDLLVTDWPLPWTITRDGFAQACCVPSQHRHVYLMNASEENKVLKVALGWLLSLYSLMPNWPSAGSLSESWSGARRGGLKWQGEAERLRVNSSLPQTQLACPGCAVIALLV